MSKSSLFKHILAVGAFLLTTGSVQSQENNPINITTTAVPFLRILPDARSGSMGDAGIALSPDANSIYYNLAKTPFLASKAGIGASYNPWLQGAADDMYLLSLAGFYRLSGEQAISASMRYFSLGTVPLVDYNGNKLMSLRPSEYALELGYARKLSGAFGIGLTGRYIRSSLATGNIDGVSYKPGTAFAADVSLFYNGLAASKQGWTAGLTLSNLGSRISYTEENGQKEFLPANLGMGGAYTETIDDDNAITFALDINKLLVPAIPGNEEDLKTYRETSVAQSWFESFNNKAWQMGVGAEYRYKELLYLRMGYMRKTYAAGNVQNITAGIGLQYHQALVHFSYLVPTGDKTSRSPLSNTIRLGVLFNWDNKGQ
jgi:hypothetical protein